MRCTKHISDRSSTLGVCASCLREQLFILIAAQSQSQQHFLESEEDRRKSDTHRINPPPLIFPSSVSPYISRRSNNSSWHDRRFYSTPQIGPTTTSTTIAAAAAESETVTATKKKKHSKFNLLSNFFRSSTRSTQPDQQIPDPRVSTTSTTSSPITSSLFSSFISGRRKHSKHSQSPSTPHHLRNRHKSRGISPSREEEDHESPSGTSGYISESSPGWRKSVKTSRRKGQSQHSRNVSGMGFCLSPLVRASPNNHRNQKDIPPVSVGISGELGRVSNVPNLSTAASFCANRSRKIANFGKYNNYNS